MFQQLGVSVSLRSIIHSYFMEVVKCQTSEKTGFPSPYGVSFILMLLLKFSSYFFVSLFPSPYGVSFILINLGKKWDSLNIEVSVSLRSIIHSYIKALQMSIQIRRKESFRLLTEYHSFLFLYLHHYPLYNYKSFRLLTEYHSFLLDLIVFYV